MHGKTLGIIGLGAIGRRFAQIGAAIGMRVIAWTMHPNPALGFTLVPLDELYRESDVVSVHLRLSAKLGDGRERVRRMKLSAIFISTARSHRRGCTDGSVLSGKIAAAGLDVLRSTAAAGACIDSAAHVVMTVTAG
jgi:D-3-phosphoglycerate dehydrogenase